MAVVGVEVNMEGVHLTALALLVLFGANWVSCGVCCCEMMRSPKFVFGFDHLIFSFFEYAYVYFWHVRKKAESCTR